MGKKKQTDAAADAAAEEQENAPYGYDVVGADGRRIHRGLDPVKANEEAARISSLTGEKVSAKPSEGPSPSGNATPTAEEIDTPAEQHLEPGEGLGSTDAE